LKNCGDIPDARRAKASFPARVYLIALMLALAPPAVLVTGYVLMRYAEAERTRLEERLRSEARLVASALDRRFASMIEAMQVLTVAQELEPQNLEDFHARAVRARAFLGRNIVLRSLDGQQLVNARLPWGQPLPSNKRAEDALALETGRAQVSDVFESPIDQEKIVTIVIPVMRDGKPAYLLNVSQSLRFFDHMIRDVRMPDSHLGLIMDTQNVVVARNRDSGRFAGRAGVRTGPEREGASVGLNLEGEQALIGWATSELSGWRATASVRQETIDAPRRQALATIAAIGFSMILVGVAFAWGVGARLSRSLQALTRASAALGARAPVPEVITPLSEANEVGRELRNVERRLTENEARLEKSLAAAKMYSFEYNDREATITRSASASIVLGDDDPKLLNGPRGYIRSRVHPADVDRFVRTVDARSAEAGEFASQFRYIRPDGECIWIQVNGVCEPDPARDGVRVTGFARDITTRKESQIRQSLLVRELHHRVKNNLATVLALANLSGRNAVSVEDYQNKLRARIQSMARSHSLLNENSSRPGFLRTLLNDELEPYAEGERKRIHIDGPDVDLPPEAALALGMAIHELATNAGKYGALSNERGDLDVRWQAVPEDEDRQRHRLRIEWSERNGPPVTPPARKGFGSRLLESVIVQQLKGRVELRYDPDGLTAIIEARLDGVHEGQAATGVES
jgi:two-component sensor histidine kinase